MLASVFDNPYENNVPSILEKCKPLVGLGASCLNSNLAF